MGLHFTVFKGSSNGEIVEAKGYREPGPSQVLVQITHSGVCGTDEHFRHADQGLGHEGVGIIVEVGSLVHEVSDFKVGDRVGLGWWHKFCGYCKPCLLGNQTQCEKGQFFGAVDHDQGTFGTAVAWDVSAVFRVPDEIASQDAGPLMCGGATVWDPLYSHGARPGDRVGVVGIGGLGHLAIQFAAKMGMEVVVFSTSESKRKEALQFGATEFHTTGGDKGLEDVAPLDFLLITANVSTGLASYLPILAKGAKAFPLTVSTDNLDISSLALIGGGLQIIGSGVARTQAQQAMLSFAAKQNVRPQIETFPMTQAGVTEAMQKLRDGKMRYRGVIVAQ